MKNLIAIFALIGCSAAQNPYPISVHFTSTNTRRFVFRAPETFGAIQIGNTAERMTFQATGCGPDQTGEAMGRWVDVDHHRLAVLFNVKGSEKRVECILEVTPARKPA